MKFSKDLETLFIIISSSLRLDGQLQAQVGYGSTELVLGFSNLDLVINLFCAGSTWTVGDSQLIVCYCSINQRLSVTRNNCLSTEGDIAE